MTDYTLVSEKGQPQILILPLEWWRSFKTKKEQLDWTHTCWGLGRMSTFYC